MTKDLKIISLVPSLTELLVDLGLEENIVGITKFCVHPKNLRKEKVIVGGTKNIHLEKIKALQPDFILCNKEENTTRQQYKQPNNTRKNTARRVVYYQA